MQNSVKTASVSDMRGIGKNSNMDEIKAVEEVDENQRGERKQRLNLNSNKPS